MTSKVIMATALLLSFSCSAREPGVSQVAWVTGFWHVTADENKDSSLKQVMEFRADGGFILYDADCDPLNSGEATYELDGDDISVKGVYPSESSASLVIRANRERTYLTSMLPDSSTPISIERTPGNKCVRG